jgi:hypothetical protein
MALHERSLSWEEALDYIACLNAYSFLGYDDWRLPNREELRSLIFDYSTSGPALPAGWPFINLESGYSYFSSTSSFDCSETGIGSIHMWSGSESSGEFVWPVRAGVTDGNPDPTSPVNLRKTGQTATCYLGDDGAIQAGVAWPDLRFTVTYCDAVGPCANPGGLRPDPSNDVVIDNLPALYG